MRRRNTLTGTRRPVIVGPALATTEPRTPTQSSLLENLGVSRHRLRYRIVGPAQTVALRQLWLPGWVVRRDGERVPEEELRTSLASDGRIRVAVPAGETVLEAHYGRPPGAGLASGIAALGLSAWIALLGFERRARPRPRSRGSA